MVHVLKYPSSYQLEFFCGLMGLINFFFFKLMIQACLNVIFNFPYPTSGNLDLVNLLVVDIINSKVAVGSLLFSFCGYLIL